jgi:ASC-1-like (ASCH) protein
MTVQDTLVDVEVEGPEDVDWSDRLFVPLNSEPYWWFADGSKTWELRGVNDQFNERKVRVGRAVELRRGYSTDDSLWGVITGVRFFESVDEIIETFEYEKVRPDASEEEFRESVADLLDGYDSFIAFGVEIYER